MHVVGAVRGDVRARRAAETLTKAGYEVSLVSVADEGSGSDGEVVKGVHMSHLKMSRSFLSKRFSQRSFFNAGSIFARGALQLTRGKADIYHALDLPALPACYLASRLRGKPLIFESYEMPFESMASWEMTAGRRRLQRLVMPFLRRMIPRCAGVIAVSPPIVEEMKRRYQPSRISLVRNIPRYRSVVKSHRLHRHLGLEPEKRIVLYQGHLQADRGLENLIRAAKFLDTNTVIVIMGEDTEGRRSRLEGLIDATGVADGVKIIPNVPYDELLDWTASADLGMIVSPPTYSPNVRAMLPNKLFEFIMAGVPILSSPLVAVESILRSYGVGRVVASVEPADLAASIREMLADGRGLASMRRNAADAARCELNWEKEERVLVGLYQDVLGDLA
jgi:glycosyltransferase involved in cell wall biosynthesis